MLRRLMLAALPLLATACPVPPPELGRGPERPAVGVLDVLDPSAAVTVLVRPHDLLASPLGDAARAWFSPSPDEAARGGPARWFGELGGATQAAASFAREDDVELTRAVRGGDAEARALARRFAAGAELDHAAVTETPCAGARAFVAGPTAVAALAADLFALGPGADVDAACRRAAGADAASLAADPQIAPLLAALDLDAAQLVYLGRVPAALRPRLRHWGVDPLVDRRIGVAVTIGAAQTDVRLVAVLDDADAAAALVVSAADGIAFMASRRSYTAVGLSPLIRQLVPRSDGRLFVVEGALPTVAVGVVLTQLRTVEEAAQ